MGNLTVKDGPFTVTAQCFECGADASGMCIGGLGLGPFDADLRIRVGSITETFRFHCAEHEETVQQVMCSEFGSCGNTWSPHPLVAAAAMPAPECSICYRNWGSCECEGGPTA